jgi:uncharacterized protein YycO
MDKNLKSDKTFFCSELLATAYKRCGVLSEGVAASKYWPGDFSKEDPRKSVEL